MKLITDELIKQLPKLYSTENQKDPIVKCKFFTPDSSWTWYVLEYDKTNEIFFGYVCGLESEFGYFTLKELKEITVHLGLNVERDISFKPLAISIVKRIHYD